MTNNPLPKLSSPVYLQRHEAFTKIANKANDPTFKRLWRNMRDRNLNQADQQLLKETQDENF